MELLTADDVARHLRVSPHTIREWARKGRIPQIWIGPTTRRFALDAVRIALLLPVQQRKDSAHA